MHINSHRFHMIIALVFILIFPASSWSSPKKVLVMNSYHDGYEFTDNEMRGIRSVFGPHSDTLELYIHYMDSKRIDFDKQSGEYLRYLKSRYRGVKFDCVLLTDNAALDFFIKHRNDIAPKVPAVFSGINNFSDSMLGDDKNITGVVESVDIRSTLETALKMFPSAKKVVFVSDNTATGVAYFKEIAALQREYYHVIPFIYLRLGLLSLSEILDFLNFYQEDSVTFMLQANIDRDGTSYTPSETMRLARQHSAAPVFVISEPRIAHDAVGGKIVSGLQQGKQAAEMALRILEGEKADSIPILRESPNVYYFNEEELKRYGISRSVVPKNSIIFNRPSSVWMKYGQAIPYILIFIVIETVIIILLMDSIRRKKAAQILLKRYLAEKEVLIKEVHHRVKNNLSVISSLINFQRRTIKEPEIEKVLAQTQGRIQTIALIHQKLYGSSEDSHIDAKGYLEDLVGYISETFQAESRGISFATEIPTVEFKSGILKNIGLIVNETVTNSLKHAFDEEGGEIRVSLSRNSGEKWILRIADTGKGFTEHADHDSRTMGMLIIKSLADSLQGDLEIRHENPGTAFILSFNLEQT